jgi:hypothetical protein
LAHKACRDGYLVFYSRATALFRDLGMAASRWQPAELTGATGAH